MAMTSNNVYHLFQRCPCKMMSLTSETGIHMYMMKAHEMMGVWGWRQGEFLFVSCALFTNTVKGSHDRSCCFHAFSFCLYVDAGQGGEVNPVSSISSLSIHFLLYKWLALIFSRLEKRIWWRGRDQAMSVFLSTVVAWMVWSGGGGGCSNHKKKTLFINYK